MKFAQVIEELKDMKHAERVVWGGAGHIGLATGGPMPALCMVTQGAVVPWSPNWQDMTADDWTVYHLIDGSAA